MTIRPDSQLSRLLTQLRQHPDALPRFLQHVQQFVSLTRLHNRVFPCQFFQRLPSDMLQHILTFSSFPEEVVSLSGVCRHMRAQTQNLVKVIRWRDTCVPLTRQILNNTILHPHIQHVILPTGTDLLEVLWDAKKRTDTQDVLRHATAIESPILWRPIAQFEADHARVFLQGLPAIQRLETVLLYSPGLPEELASITRGLQLNCASPWEAGDLTRFTQLQNLLVQDAVVGPDAPMPRLPESLKALRAAYHTNRRADRAWWSPPATLVFMVIDIVDYHGGAHELGPLRASLGRLRELYSLRINCMRETSLGTLLSMLPNPSALRILGLVFCEQKVPVDLTSLVNLQTLVWEQASFPGSVQRGGLVLKLPQALERCVVMLTEGADGVEPSDSATVTVENMGRAIEHSLGRHALPNFYMLRVVYDTRRVERRYIDRQLLLESLLSWCPVEWRVEVGPMLLDYHYRM